MWLLLFVNDNTSGCEITIVVSDIPQVDNKDHNVK